MVPEVLNGIEIRALRWPWHAADAVRPLPPSRVFAGVAGRVVVLEYDAMTLLVNLLQLGRQVVAEEVDIAESVERALDQVISPRGRRRPADTILFSTRWERSFMDSPIPGRGLG